ncbi:MAG: heavy-metal-associated domain-containing protein [Stutzerimonas stutzeri]
MTCASCVGRVERALLKVPGVRSAAVNLASERAHVEVIGTPDPAALIQAVEAAGYKASAGDQQRPEEDAERRLQRERWAVIAGLLLAATAGGADVRRAVRAALDAAGVDAARCWRRRCSSGLGARFYRRGLARRCAPVPATWTCWWRSAPAPATG